MPEEDYGALGVTVPLGSDSPPDVPTAFKDFADSLVEARPIRGSQGASSTISLTSDIQDVPGAAIEVTPTAESRLRVWAYFNFSLNPSGLSEEEVFAAGSLAIDSESHQKSKAVFAIEPEVSHPEEDLHRLTATVSQFFEITLAAGSHVAKLQAWMGVHGKASCSSTDTQFAYELSRV